MVFLGTKPSGRAETQQYEWEMEEYPRRAECRTNMTEEVMETQPSYKNVRYLFTGVAIPCIFICGLFSVLLVLS
jgi:hypothetical protein